jgi:hypothetical protein
MEDDYMAQVADCWQDRQRPVGVLLVCWLTVLKAHELASEDAAEQAPFNPAAQHQ